MGRFEVLVDFIKQILPDYAYLVTPGKEIAADGVIFRARAPDGLIFKDENGEQVITLADAQSLIVAEL